MHVELDAGLSPRWALLHARLRLRRLLRDLDATYDSGGTLSRSDYGPHNLTMLDSSSHVLAKVTKGWANDGFTDSWEAAS
jgi:hypothetical protein